MDAVERDCWRAWETWIAHVDIEFAACAELKWQSIFFGKRCNETHSNASRTVVADGEDSGVEASGLIDLRVARVSLLANLLFVCGPRLRLVDKGAVDEPSIHI
jgi:hypothetical protein